MYIYIYVFIMYLAGGQCFMGGLIGSSISKYPALFTFEQRKMMSSFVFVTEERLFYKTAMQNKSLKYNDIWQ